MGSFRLLTGSEGDAVDLMNSLGPLLQHLAGALQQPGASTSLQQVQSLHPLLRMQKLMFMWFMK